MAGLPRSPTYLKPGSPTENDSGLDLSVGDREGSVLDTEGAAPQGLGAEEAGSEELSSPGDEVGRSCTRDHRSGFNPCRPLTMETPR